MCWLRIQAVNSYNYGFPHWLLIKYESLGCCWSSTRLVLHRAFFFSVCDCSHCVFSKHIRPKSFFSWGVEALLLIYHFPRPRLLMQRLLLKARYYLSKHMAFFLQARRLLLLASLSVAVVTVFFQNTYDQKVFSKLTYSKQTYKQTTNYITKHIQQTAIKL